MIRIEELMIGDWVLFHDTPQQVTYLNLDDGERVGTTKEYYAQPIECFEPIPITSEILEKNGFKQEDNDCYLWNENLERIIWFEGGYTVITSVRCDKVYEGHCNNIHELQHALRLCGITKNIGL